MSDINYSILIVGVGGQGVLLASEILSEVAMNFGLDVKKSEVHGMSQRGGIVSSHIKIADKVYSPTIRYGQADFLISFEQAEGLRAMDWMKKDGAAIVSTTKLIPAIVTSKKEYNYPLNAIETMKTKAEKIIAVKADTLAAELGNPRLVNTILMGVLSNFMVFPLELWLDVIRNRVKSKFVDINIEAFNKGREIKLSSVEV
ncbi:MAG: indolepyruvate oxidoreductase subunit beta [Calditrichaeota bacterium]|nr:MAG: indolepyruvate oxidoreductase subunit beta [Calditrichota bacterium]